MEFIFKYMAICLNRLVFEIPQTSKLSRLFKKITWPPGPPGRYFWGLSGPTECLVSEKAQRKSLQEQCKVRKFCFQHQELKDLWAQTSREGVSEEIPEQRGTKKWWWGGRRPGLPIPLLSHFPEGASKLRQQGWVLGALGGPGTAAPALWGLPIL